MHDTLYLLLHHSRPNHQCHHQRALTMWWIDERMEWLCTSINTKPIMRCPSMTIKWPQRGQSIPTAVHYPQWIAHCPACTSITASCHQMRSSSTCTNAYAFLQLSLNNTRLYDWIEHVVPTKTYIEGLMDFVPQVVSWSISFGHFHTSRRV